MNYPLVLVTAALILSGSEAHVHRGMKLKARLSLPQPVCPSCPHSLAADSEPHAHSGDSADGLPPTQTWLITATWTKEPGDITVTKMIVQKGIIPVTSY